jgi:biopolymer transport protein ExbD
LVVVRADKAATFGSVRGLLATAQERGFARFTLIVLRGGQP